MDTFNQEASDEANISQNQIFAALQQILLENLDINRQNTDAIKDSVKAAQDYLHMFAGGQKATGLKLNKYLVYKKDGFQ